MTEEARERKRERDRRYNASAKGRARNRRYEDKHPERGTRWESARNSLRPRNGW